MFSSTSMSIICGAEQHVVPEKICFVGATSAICGSEQHVAPRRRSVLRLRLQYPARQLQGHKSIRP